MGRVIKHRKYEEKRNAQKGKNTHTKMK